MATGKVKWFDPNQGYGFIEMADKKIIFVQHKDIQGSKTLDEGQVVEFEICSDPKGRPYAENVVRV
ncbi:MAG TPA: cold shock domain-containing protein [Candidatus Kapabacteria bacterium]|nr:cold shock domain-containing protein [Candidatus Kapabacteria bacterium]